MWMCQTCIDLSWRLETWDTDPTVTLDRWARDRNVERRRNLRVQLLAVGQLARQQPDLYRNLLDGEAGLDALTRPPRGT